jgi:hypothetical protein
MSFEKQTTEIDPVSLDEKMRIFAARVEQMCNGLAPDMFADNFDDASSIVMRANGLSACLQTAARRHRRGLRQ